jgi:hypothetical protein
MRGLEERMGIDCAPEAAGPSFGHIDRNPLTSVRMEKSLGDNSRIRVGKYLWRLRSIEEPINRERTTESSLMNPSTSSAILERKLTADNV